MKDNNIDTLLKCKLINGKDYTLEDLAEEFQTDKASIHKSFMRLNTLTGWSIRPYNMLPYRKSVKAVMKHLTTRTRLKGERYTHNHAEPDWERTLYCVRRPI